MGCAGRGSNNPPPPRNGISKPQTDAPPRKIAFIIAATDQGTLIVNRFDYNFYENDPKRPYGLGRLLLENTSYQPGEIFPTLRLLDLRRKYFGDGVFAIDCGANIGIYTLEWAKHMTQWGSVIGIEAQERIFYALAGNIAINNCFNARALHAAITKQPGMMKIPNLDYSAPASFGSLELRKLPQTETIGQTIDYSEQNMVDVRAVSIDSLNLDRVDLIKIDVEGMELDVLEGAGNCLSRHRPILTVEWIKSGRNKLVSWLAGFGYKVFEQSMNLIAVHQSDKCLGHMRP